MINKVFIGCQFGISQISGSENSHVYKCISTANFCLQSESEHIVYVHFRGGYVNLLQQPQFSALGENFHFVGHTQNFAPIFSSPSPSAQREPSSHQGTGRASIDIDGDDDVVETNRTAKRRHWSHEEEVRLVKIFGSKIIIDVFPFNKLTVFHFSRRVLG